MIEYFFLELTVIAIEKSYENNQKENLRNFTIIFISTFIFFFYLTISFSKFLKYCKFLGCGILERKKKAEEKEIKTGKYKKKNDIISKLSNEILDGTHGILIFNCIFSLVFSAFYFKDKYKKLFFNDTNYILIPILMNKFYYFTLIFYCLDVSEEKKGFELISGSTIISIYMNIWNLIINIIKNYISNLDILYVLQIIFISIPSLIIALLFLFLGVCNALCHCHLLTFLWCVISFIFCFGGLWIKVNQDWSQEYNFKECCDFCDCCGCFQNCNCKTYSFVSCFDIIVFFLTYCFISLMFIAYPFAYCCCGNENCCCFCKCCADCYLLNNNDKNKSEKIDNEEEKEIKNDSGIND